MVIFNGFYNNATVKSDECSDNDTTERAPTHVVISAPKMVLYLTRMKVLYDQGFRV
jgi:hypothetical protein